jgi:hypothetical protein
MNEHGGYNPTGMPRRETEHAGVTSDLRVVERRFPRLHSVDHGGWNPTGMPRRESEHAGVIAAPPALKRAA